MKITFDLVDRDATEVGGHPVEDGAVLLTEAQAEHWLRMGAIRRRHPLDHDGDGKIGGSLPGRRRARAKKETPPWQE